MIDTPSKKPIQKVEVISDDIELITTEDVKTMKITAVAGAASVAATAAAAPASNSTELPTSTTNNETVNSDYFQFICVPSLIPLFKGRFNIE